MTIALELSERQTSRVIEQALRANAKLEIEPLPERCPELIWGSVQGRLDKLLIVHLTDDANTVDLLPLTGATCDVRTVLSGELYLFSTVIVDVDERCHPRRLVLAEPSIIRSANRRRFPRHASADRIELSIRVPGREQAGSAELLNIGTHGIGCLAPGELVDAMLVGEPVIVALRLTWLNESFVLPAFVCNKNRPNEDGSVLVGLEFIDPPQSPDDAAAMRRLRELMLRETESFIEMDGVS